MTDITVINFIKDYDLYKFTFDWANKHWKNHYRELAKIDNEIFILKKSPMILDMKSIVKITKGTDPEQNAFLYLKHIDIHIAFIAKLILTYGYKSVVFEDETK